MEVFFNMYKIKFEILNKLILNSNIDLSKDNYVYINLEPLLRRIVHADIDKDLRIKKDERVLEFISYVFNLASHYRLYFASKKTYCKIYLYMGYPFDVSYINNDINNNYRNAYKETFSNSINVGLRNIIEDSVELIKMIFEYIDGVYMIESGNVEPSLIPLIIDNMQSSNSKNNFIVSADVYDYQYCLKDFYILRPKQKNSYILYKGNVIQQMMIENKMLYDEFKINYNTIPFILSILGNETRSIEKIKGIGFKSVVKGIQKGIDSGLISDKVNNIFILSKILKEEIQEHVFQNYICTDLDSQFKKIKEVEKNNIMIQIKDKFDNKQLKEMNDDYFTYNPLNLLEILSACKYKNIKLKLF